jgi:hypothetical protein
VQVVAVSKLCVRCKETKPLAEFPSQQHRSDGKHSYCRKCVYEYKRQWSKDNREREKAQKRRWYAANPSRRRVQDWKRRGIALAWSDWQAMLTVQHNLCAVCGEPEGKGRMETFALDHDHKTGQIRGILHRRCNVALGLMQDDSELLRRAARYLEGNWGANVRARPRRRVA